MEVINVNNGFCKFCPLLNSPSPSLSSIIEAVYCIANALIKTQTLGIAERERRNETLMSQNIKLQKRLIKKEKKEKGGRKKKKNKKSTKEKKKHGNESTAMPSSSGLKSGSWLNSPALTDRSSNGQFFQSPSQSLPNNHDPPSGVVSLKPPCPWYTVEDVKPATCSNNTRESSNDDVNHQHQPVHKKVLFNPHISQRPSPTCRSSK